MKKLFSKSSGIAFSLAAVAGLMLSGCDKEETALLPGDAGVITQTAQEDGSVLLSIDEIANAKTYNWYKNGESVQNTDSRTYLAVESGLYKVAGVNANGEGKASEEVSVEIIEPDPELPEEYNILSEEFIPNAAFREWIKTNIAGGKDTYTNKEAATYDGDMTFDETEVLEITDLKGIEYFTSLQSLTFTDNTSLRTLDLSSNTELKYLDLSYSEVLIELNLDGLEKLESLMLGHTGLSEFDISKYEETLSGSLRHLVLSSLGLKSIDLKPFTKLESVDLTYSPFVSLDVSGMPSLRTLWCSNAWNMESVDVTGCVSLDSLILSFCNLRSLDLSTNENLSLLAIQFNENLGDNVELSHLKNLEFLNISYNGMTEMVDFSGFTKLDYLECENNAFSGVLDLSDCPLTILRCENNEITELDISSSTGMTELYCYSNELERLDISMCRDMVYLCCEDNPMTEIKVWPEFDMNNPPIWMKDEKANYVYEFGEDPGTDPDNPEVEVPDNYKPWVGTWNVHATQSVVWVPDPENPGQDMPEFEDTPMDMTVTIEYKDYCAYMYGWNPDVDEALGAECGIMCMIYGDGLAMWAGMSPSEVENPNQDSNTLVWCGVGEFDSGKAEVVTGQIAAYTWIMDESSETATARPFSGMNMDYENYTVNGFDLYSVDLSYGDNVIRFADRSPAGDITMTRVQ